MPPTSYAHKHSQWSKVTPSTFTATTQEPSFVAEEIGSRIVVHSSVCCSVVRVLSVHRAMLSDLSALLTEFVTRFESENRIRYSFKLRYLMTTEIALDFITVW